VASESRAVRVAPVIGSPVARVSETGAVAVEAMSCESSFRALTSAESAAATWRSASVKRRDCRLGVGTLCRRGTQLGGTPSSLLRHDHQRDERGDEGDDAHRADEDGAAQRVARTCRHPGGARVRWRFGAVPRLAATLVHVGMMASRWSAGNARRIAYVDTTFSCTTCTTSPTSSVRCRTRHGVDVQLHIHPASFQSR
jgi:hypothetical protein